MTTHATHAEAQIRPAEQAEIRLSTVAEMRAHAGTLFGQHWDEIARNKAVMVLAPDWDRYQMLEDGGVLLCLAAFHGEQVVGYSVTFVHGHLHYSNLTYAQNDVLFVTKAARSSRLGLRLLAETERLARERGARLMLWHAKDGTALDALLPRLGYAVQDIIYSKEL